jgi:hypothetical protein
MRRASQITMIREERENKKNKEIDFVSSPKL